MYDGLCTKDSRGTLKQGVSSPLEVINLTKTVLFLCERDSATKNSDSVVFLKLKIQCPL